MGLREIIEYNLKVDKRIFEKIRVVLEGGSDERIHCKIKSGGYKQYYISNLGEGEQHYISIKNSEYIEELKKMRRLRETFAILKGNIAAEVQFLKKFKNINFDILKVDLAEAFPIDKTGEIIQSENPFKREHLNLTTSFGLLVRSRGEAIIAELLYRLGIVFRYEKALDLMDENGNRVRLYPDFTIYLPGGIIIYWEHKGMMQNEKYRDRDEVKMELYHANGIFEPLNLIVTADGPNGELNIKVIELLINGYILNLPNVVVAS